MIRRILYIILLIQTMGFLLLAWQIIGLHKYRIQQQIKNGTYTGSTIAFRFATLQEVNDLSDEFEYEGQMYDVVSVNREQDEYVVVALKDITEQLLIDLFIGSDINAQNTQNAGTKSLFQLIYIAGAAVLSNHSEVNYNQRNQYITELLNPELVPIAFNYDACLLNPPEAV
jgi:hypothetical protein